MIVSYSTHHLIPFPPSPLPSLLPSILPPPSTPKTTLHARIQSQNPTRSPTAPFSPNQLTNKLINQSNKSIKSSNPSTAARSSTSLTPLQDSQSQTRGRHPQVRSLTNTATNSARPTRLGGSSRRTRDEMQRRRRKHRHLACILRCFVYVGFPGFLVALFVFEEARLAVLRVRSLPTLATYPTYVPTHARSKRDRRGLGRWLVMTGWFRWIV